MVFIVLGLLLPGRVAMSASATAALPAVETYEQLISEIRQAKAESRGRVEALVEAEKVREAWEIGKLIDRHVLQHQKRANYDQQVIERLARDLGESKTDLYYMLEFARTYPIVRPAGELSWSHYQALLALNDSKERKEVTEQAMRESWGRDRVREEVRRRQAARGSAGENKPVETVLTAEPGKPGTYRVVKAHYGNKPEQLVLDLGFSNYYHPPGKFPFKEGDIVQENKGRFKKSKDASEKDLFTYTAAVIGVIDGDTFTAAVELGFGFATVQTLRLRAIDAPEIESAEGREATEFLEKILPSSLNVLIRTHRSDKYDRYLADVFVSGEYLNQKLVDEGFAKAVGE